MSMTMENVVTGIEVRKIKDGTQTVYDVIDKDGVKWTAWEKDLAERAYKLKDQPALWQVDVKQNGNFTNRNLKGIEAKATGGFSPALSAMEASLGTNNAQTGSWEPGGPTTSSFEGMVQEPSYKDRTIWRQTASKVAAQLGGTQLEIWANIAILMEFYETGRTPIESFGDPGPSPHVPQDEDIPF